MLDDIKALQEEVQSLSISTEKELEDFRLEFLSAMGKYSLCSRKWVALPKKTAPKLERP
jgi:hypothetical protein